MYTFYIKVVKIVKTASKNSIRRHLSICHPFGRVSFHLSIWTSIISFGDYFLLVRLVLEKLDFSICITMAQNHQFFLLSTFFYDYKFLLFLHEIVYDFIWLHRFC
jgi:hypothetical protein